MRALVCGGRDFNDTGAVFAALDAIHAETPISLIIQGGARGADHAADLWAYDRGAARLEFRADWVAHGKGAGPRRNQTMLEAGKPDIVVAFPGGKGTADMVRRAKLAGVAVREVSP